MENYNLSRSELISHSLKKEETWLSKDGALCTYTGKYTGRAAKDKFIVIDSQTINSIDWNSHFSFEKEWFDKLYGRVLAYLQGQETYIQTLIAGINTKLMFKLTTTSPKAAAFSLNMFYSSNNINNQFEILHVPDFKANAEFDHTNSEAFIVINFSKRIVLIGGTHYAGEIKKAVFTVMNFILPQLNVLPMHASANEDLQGDNSCVFFGLSGTGKTTLSSDENRVLIGDDEIGWDDTGLFNFENGCYAKTLNLSQKDEPQIWDAVNKFGTVLENVDTINGFNDVLNFNSNKFTENSRASYLLSNITNSSKTRKGKHPKNIIMLAYDAFGVLPPVSKLSFEEAYYFFISGYTAKISGTEAGIKEPVAAFSTCFGAPFMPLSPLRYASLFYDKIKKYNCNVYLINTGLQGGEYGEGHRISIRNTRRIIHSILTGDINQSYFSRNDNIFKLNIPSSIQRTDDLITNPKNSWLNKDSYDIKAQKLIDDFRLNFSKYKNIPNEVMSISL